MQLPGKLKLELKHDAKDFVNLYSSLGERAENFLPSYIFEKLATFVRLCYEPADDIAKIGSEINKQIIELKEAIPGYVDVSLMLSPHEDSKAFQYRTQKLEFVDRLTALIDNESVDENTKNQANNILASQDFSIGTPPVTQNLIDYLYDLLLGNKADEFKKFTEVIGITDDQEKSQWNYLLEVLDQMIIQSTHYTTVAEKRDFLEKTELTVNYKGLNGFIRTVVSANSGTTIKLISEEVFRNSNVKIIEYQNQEILFETIKDDFTNIFVVKIKNMRRNILTEKKWFPYLSRIIFVDDSFESQATNTSLVFCFHNGIINTLNKVHNKKLGSLANTQLNLRLILDKINVELLKKFVSLLENKIKDYQEELDAIKTEQIGELHNVEKNTMLYKFDDFAQQIIKDKYAVTKLNNYIKLIININNPEIFKIQNTELIAEYEMRTRQYSYSNNKYLQIATITEGGGRNQIRTYGEYLLQRKLKPIDSAILKKCRTILDIIPNNYSRTLKNHFHKNFGINLFLERYKEHLTKRENEADNKGRFTNFLLDLGIKNQYDSKTEEEKNILKSFLSDLGNIDKTSISDDVQMIIRDILFHKEESLRPYILYNMDLSWEYQDLFPFDRFDINSFDLEIGMNEEGRIYWQRLTLRLMRMKSTFTLFDDTGNLWDRFCENLTIVINDPSNPTGYTDFNNENFVTFLKFIGMTKITLFLDEAYNDSVKNPNILEPKWRSISRYVLNNIQSFPNISIVSSISTTKNLSGTGNRLGCLVATPMRQDVISYAKQQNSGEYCNTNSIYMLIKILETAQRAKKYKDQLEEYLSQNASWRSIKKCIADNIKSDAQISDFEGSPLHIFLLDELKAIDKLEVLNLPDDFIYKGQAFFKYYHSQLLRNLNNFRVNKVFLKESALRMQIAKDIANEVITQNNYDRYAKIVNSDGSYLFNLILKDITSYQGLEKFTKKLTEQRGIAVIPYKTGFVRFSMGGYLQGNDKSYDDFGKEFKNALQIFFKYWTIYIEARNDIKNKNKRSEDLLKEIFASASDKEFINNVIIDFYLIKDIKKTKIDSLKISNEITLYLAFPTDSGVCINGIPESKNSVFEFSEIIGNCTDIKDFIRSKAFTKIYENLLPQIYKNIPAIKKLDYRIVRSKYGKPTILKYIENKFDNQPNNYVLDDADEISIMKEILIEMENILFSNAKFKIMALNASNDVNFDRQRLEGANQILKKFIKELLINFNLPFANNGHEPSIKELFFTTLTKYQEITRNPIIDFGIKSYTEALMHEIRYTEKFVHLKQNDKYIGLISKYLLLFIDNKETEFAKKILFLYLLKRDKNFENLLLKKIAVYENQIVKYSDSQDVMFAENILYDLLNTELESILLQIGETENTKISITNLHNECRRMAIFIIDIINRTKSTEYYDKYTHFLMKFTEIEFKRQNSAINEMIQHGITIYSGFDNQENILYYYNNGSLKWINEMLKNCGVISAEQPVQMHTRIVTDAKKREYPFHKIDRTEHEEELRKKGIENSKLNPSINDYIKNLAPKPNADFFAKRLEKFVKNIDKQDYRCKIIAQGLIKELVVFHKSYIKYLADNYRLLSYNDVTLEQIKTFVPDVIMILGAPEKVISFPQIGYFDLNGPNGKIKTLITPLKKKVDYFGDVKKPRLTMINEKVKEMGGIPVHGSMFAVEEEDGAIFVVEVSGDSGVGKSEMLAALMLKWLKKDMNRIRSIKLIAGDMFHIFPDQEGNLYGIGTEVGDFSRVTDFDPEYIKYYNSLFENASDSNVEDLNSRSTISGLCDISMPYKIDIMLTASNFARQEAGVIRYDNPENFIYYRESHGERKEKATSSDHPHFQRTLLRYTAYPNIVSVLDKHGNYLDEILDWQKDDRTTDFYLASSYKLIDKIDIEDIVKQIFVDKTFIQNNVTYKILNIQFDIIKNRFNATATDTNNNTISVWITKNMFANMFNALASTPTGQPFISEEGQIETKLHLLNILKGKYGKGKGTKIQLGLLSTDIGRKGREISGPQKAAEELQKLIQEVRIENPEINANKQKVRNTVIEHYKHIFVDTYLSPEILRYNFVLWQIEQMRKAEFVRIDDMKTVINMSKLKGFKPLKKNYEFSPLLVTPNINTEINSFSETYLQIMSLPNNNDFSEEFFAECHKLYIARGYSQDTIVNNMILQLLIMHGHLSVEDLNRSKIMEKANRETIAAAKFAVIKFLNNN